MKYSFKKKKRASNFDKGEGHATSVITGASLLSPSGSVQQHGLCSSRDPCTTKVEEEDTSDVIFTHSDSSLLLLLLLWLLIAGRESKAAQIKENLEPACTFPYLCHSLYKKQDILGRNEFIFSLQCIDKCDWSSKSDLQVHYIWIRHGWTYACILSR